MVIWANSAEAFADILPSGFLEPPTAEPLSGPIATWTREIFSSPDGTTSAGYWQVEAGRSRWDFDYTEVIWVVEGEVTVTEDGGEPVRLSPGDVGVFPVGWKGEWDVPDGLKKFYVVFPGACPSPSLRAVGVSAW
jgi:uncharacterized cupin superfamily protein